MTEADALTEADAAVERGSDRLRTLSRRAAAAGGLRAKLAPTLAEDSAFLRKLKPSLMVARARGEASTNQPPGEPAAAPLGPQHGKRRKKNGGPSPLLVVVAAGAAGVLLAKVIDWRGHAHPRD
jgi:hypothetical protein